MIETFSHFSSQSPPQKTVLFYLFFVISFIAEMAVDCKIIFENPDRVYYSGQILSGTVEFTLTEKLKVKSEYGAEGWKIHQRNL
jgi:hypothetical protein